MQQTTSSDNIFRCIFEADEGLKTLFERAYEISAFIAH